MIELPADAVAWGNSLDLRGAPPGARERAARIAASYMAKAHERGCAIHWTNDLAWAERVAMRTPLPHVWAPLRAHHWPDFRQSTSVIALAPTGGGLVVATICIRLLWIEGDLGEAMLSQFGTQSFNEILKFGGDLSRDVRDCHVAWACGLWRADQLRGTRIGHDLVTLAAIDALARWRWSWFLGVRRPSAQDRLGLSPFNRLEAPVVSPDTRELMLVAAGRKSIREAAAAL